MSAQIVHAAGESSPGSLGPGTYAVVLAADQDRLTTLEALLRSQGVPHKAIREHDAPYRGELMAIGLRPAPRDQVQRYVSSLPLLR